MVDRYSRNFPEFDRCIPKWVVRDSAGSSCCALCCWQMLYSVRSERLLMEEIDYNILFRWFVG